MRGFSEAHIQIPQAETAERIVAPVINVAGQQRGPKIQKRRAWILKIVESRASSAWRAGGSHTYGTQRSGNHASGDPSVNAASQGFAVDQRNLASRGPEVEAAAEGLSADGNQFWHSAAFPEDTSGVPTADDLVDRSMAAAPPSFAEWQLVVEDRIEHVGPVEERRSIIQVRVETG